MSKQRSITQKTALIGDSISENSWVSQDILDAQAGEQVEMGQTIEDVSKGDEVDGGSSDNE